jgi:hypothetical protein
MSFRRVLLILLSLALPFNGWASMAVVDPCPMQSAMADHGPMAQMKDSCCKDHDKSIGKADKPCKPGQECQSSALYVSATAFQTSSLPRSTLSVPLPTLPASTAALSGVWRPPRV